MIKNKKTLLLFLVLLFPVIIVIISLIIISLTRYTLPTIQNFSDYSHYFNNNKQIETLILSSLDETIRMNTDATPSSINDFIIRNGSFSQTENNSIYQTSFIIDSESLQQSYILSFEWNYESLLSVGENEYNGSFLCLSKSELKIYPDYDCKDILTHMFGTNDPDARKLPYISPHKFKISYLIPAKKVIVNIFQCLSSYTDEAEAEAKAWLKENNISMDKVIIKYCSE